MNLIFGFCVYMTFIYMPYDLFVKPMAVDDEVWFGVFLIITAGKMLFMNVEDSDPRNNIVVRLTRRLFPVTKHFHGQRFVVRRGGRMFLTPLALALVMVETTDVIFAVDSIPAIFAITADPFLVFASNAFAILGLRSLYFVLAGALTTSPLSGRGSRTGDRRRSWRRSPRR